MTGASGAPAGGAVVVVDGVDVPASPSAAVPATAAAWLAEWAPRGVYTATRTTDHHARLCRWDAHVKRLRLMLSAFRDHDPASFASAPELPATDEAMRALVAPTVERALARRRAMTANVVEGLASSSSSSSSSAPAPRESMVVVAVSPTARGAWRVGAHACAFDAAAKLPPATCAVAPGSRRPCPSVKDTSWPRLRDATAAATRARFRAGEPFDEILLSDEHGDALFEGGVSNVFVVVKETRREDERERLGSATDVFVQTAPVEACLAGVGRAAVLDACAVLGVRVVEKTPRLSENTQNTSEWCEAFLTNAVRGVRGVREICFSNDVRATFANRATDASVAARLEAYFDALEDES
jgi:branched-subunit amino acid aminotransferase/4-amino-4-deoxychorismate lyase